MNLDQRLERVAVLGAGGKMGSGIAWLLAKEMTLLGKKNNNLHSFRLTLMDVNPDALSGVQSYLKSQAAKFATKKAEELKEFYSDVASDDELASAFQADLTSIIHPTTELQEVKDALMVFEAILENLDLKTKVYKELKTLCPPETYFFTNTSSIPIKELDTRAELGGKIIGFHFYNPPAVQRLVELIIPERIDPELPELSKTLARRLGKIVIPSNDVAGFIGNGHFMRDGLHGISEAQRLSEEMGWVPAIYLVNRVSQQFLIRPMGIFQLIDYVGIDVFQSILNIMNPYFPDENLHSTLIDKMVSLGVKGGQYPDGSQKDGFLKYESGKIVGIFNPDSGEYQMLNDGTWKAETDEKIGPLPEGHQSWKDLLKNPERESVLKAYFDNLKMMDTLGARVAKQYLHRSKEIGLQLLNSGVANTAEDVNGVLMNGFYHLYGPINDFI